MQPESLRKAQEWLVRAEHDLQGAAVLIQQTPPLLDLVAYHTQQAAEKALKGFLTAHERPFEKSHILEPLVKVCAAFDPDFAKFTEAAQVLTPYVFKFRYPGGPLEPSLAEASDAYESALQIVRYVQSRVALLHPGS